MYFTRLFFAAPALGRYTAFSNIITSFPLFSHLPITARVNLRHHCGTIGRFTRSVGKKNPPPYALVCQLQLERYRGRMKIGFGQPDRIQTSGTILVWGSGDNEAGQHQTPLDSLNRNRKVIRHDADLDNSAKVSLAMFDDCDALCKPTGRRCAQHFTNGKFRCRRAALLAVLWRRQIGETSRPSAGTPCRTSPPQEHFPTLHPPLYQLSTALTGL